MKRSEINAALRELEAVCEKCHCYLLPFCHFTPEERQTKGHEYSAYNHQPKRVGWGQLLFQQHIDPMMVARLLGHSDTKMLMKIYDHTDVSTLRKILAAARSA